MKLKLIKNILKNINCSEKGSCMVVAELLTQAFLINNYKTFKVIEGYVWFGDYYNRHQHTWIKINGKIIDPTLIQFKHWNLKKVKYGKIKKKYTPQQYLDLCQLFPIIH